jgi:hypothetical protein
MNDLRRRAREGDAAARWLLKVLTEGAAAMSGAASAGRGKEDSDRLK